MCAVCWSGTQIIPATAIAARYVWINHFQMRRLSKSTASVDKTEDELTVADELLEEADFEDVDLEPCEDEAHRHDCPLREPLGV